MKLFDIFKKKKYKEETSMATLEEVRKAYEDLSDDDKKAFRQIFDDRGDGAADGEDGTEGGSAPEQKDVAPEKEQTGETDVRSGEDGKPQAEGADRANDEAEEWRRSADERFSRIEAALEKLEQQGKRTSAPADGATAERLKRAESIYS